MPQQIEVPGMGIVEFPDGMSDDKIAAAIKNNMEPSLGQVLSETWPAKIAKSIYSAVTLPGDVMQGKAQLPSRDGGISGSVPYGDPNSAGERVADFAMLASPINPAIRAGDRAVAGMARAPMKQPNTPAPSAEALKEAAQTGYKQAGELGVDISPEAIKNLGARLSGDLERDGINAKLAPKTFSILSDISNPPQGSVFTVQNFDTLRKTFGHAAGDFTNPTERLAASRAIQHLDDYLANIPQTDVLAGPAPAASKLLSDARGNYAAAARSERIDDKLYAAETRAGAANSGANVGNSTRQRIADILLRPKERRGYSPEEITQMERVVGGTATGNTVRRIGNVMGGGGGLGAMISAAVGGAATAPFYGVGAAAPLVGALLKQGEGASVARQSRLLDEMVRKRSPLYESRPAEVSTSDLAKREAMIRALLMGQQQ